MGLCELPAEQGPQEFGKEEKGPARSCSSQQNAHTQLRRHFAPLESSAQASFPQLCTHTWSVPQSYLSQSPAGLPLDRGARRRDTLTFVSLSSWLKAVYNSSPNTPS